MSRAPSGGAALQEAAAAAIVAGDLDGGRRLLDQATAVHGAAGEVAQAAIATAFSSQLSRAAGDVQTAHEQAVRATGGAGDDPRALAAAHTALGEVELAMRRPDLAAVSLAVAAAHEHDESRRAHVLRLRGAALWATGAARSAGWALGEAARLQAVIGDQVGAVATLLQRATVLADVGGAVAEEAAEVARAAAESAGIGGALAGVGMLDAARALDGGDPALARTLLLEARAAALEDVDVLRYLGSVSALAELAAVAGDDVEAYGVLSSGWVTLGDLVGEQTARSVFRPRLLTLWDRWGEAHFAEVKAASEAAVQGRKGAAR